jgi:hypothetical protein
MVDGRKGTCNESKGEGDSKCVPVIGHLAAFLKSDASSDDVLATKISILDSIQDVMTNNKANPSQHTIYISEHKNEQIQQAKNHANGDDTAESSNGSVLGIVFALLSSVACAVMVLMLHRRKNKAKKLNGESNENSDGDPTIEDTFISSLDGEGDGMHCPTIKDEICQDNCDIVSNDTSPAISDDMISNVMDACSDSDTKPVDTSSSLSSSDGSDAQIDDAVGGINVEECDCVTPVLIQNSSSTVLTNDDCGTSLVIQSSNDDQSNNNEIFPTVETDNVASSVSPPSPTV